MIDSSRSQRGGIATWQGLDYQKRFIAYLSISMLSEKNQIIRITCEDLDDIKRRKDDMIPNHEAVQICFNRIIME